MALLVPSFKVIKLSALLGVILCLQISADFPLLWGF